MYVWMQESNGGVCVIKIVGYCGEWVHSAGCCEHGNEPSGSIK